MNRKKIREHLNKVCDMWLESITDKEVRRIVKGSVIISGGAIPSLLTGTTPNDYDIYLSNKEAVIAISQYYIDNYYKDKGIKIEEPEEGRVFLNVRASGVSLRKKTDEEKKNKTLFVPKFLSNNAISLHDKVQVITRFYGKPHEILENFDYVHCLSFWESSSDNLVLNSEAMESLLMKRLVYQGSKYPLCSLFRMRKFIKRGWTISGGQILKMAFQVSELNLKDIDVLREQLIGVDTAYFVQLLGRLEKDNKTTIDEAYISQLVDEIFEIGE